jgi:tetraacyldisaccharide 4'-kinase
VTSFTHEIIQHAIQRAWQRKNALFYLVLIPLSWLFALLVSLRRLGYQFGLLKSFALPVPVIIIGNINVGGSGKTPAVIWLVNQLKQQGYKPAVISRGYGGSATQATSVTPASLPSIVGDEPVLIASRSLCPVWIGADRVQVGQALLKAHPECNVIISDDGLQHYRLKRDVEIAIVDATMLPQGAYLLPAGPLRESPSRLNTVDAIVCNAKKNIETTFQVQMFQMQLVGEQFYNLKDSKITATADDFKRKSIKALAGIGKPERFFEHLRNLGLNFASASFEDHYAFTAEDLAKIDCDILIMTEKDAVKCKAFAKPHYWVLPVEASIDAALMPVILSKLAKVKR